MGLEMRLSQETRWSNVRKMSIMQLITTISQLQQYIDTQQYRGDWKLEASLLNGFDPIF